MSIESDRQKRNEATQAKPAMTDRATLKITDMIYTFLLHLAPFTYM